MKTATTNLNQFNCPLVKRARRGVRLAFGLIVLERYYVLLWR